MSAAARATALKAAIGVLNKTLAAKGSPLRVLTQRPPGRAAATAARQAWIEQYREVDDTLASDASVAAAAQAAQVGQRGEPQSRGGPRNGVESMEEEDEEEIFEDAALPPHQWDISPIQHRSSAAAAAAVAQMSPFRTPGRQKSPKATALPPLRSTHVALRKQKKRKAEGGAQNKRPKLDLTPETPRLSKLVLEGDDEHDDFYEPVTVDMKSILD